MSQHCYKDSVDSSIITDIDQRVRQSRLHVQKAQSQQIELINEMQNLKKEQINIQVQTQQKVNQYEQEVKRLESIIVKLEGEIKHMKNENKFLHEDDQRLKKRIHILDSMYQKEVKKNIELKQNVQKLQEQLNQRKQWKEDISMIQNNDQSKFQQMNQQISRYVNELQSQNGKFLSLEQNIKQKDNEINSLKKNLSDLEKTLKQMEFTASDDSKKNFETQSQTENSNSKTASKQLTSGNLIDLVGKFLDSIDSRDKVKAKNIITCFLEQRLSTFC